MALSDEQKARAVELRDMGMSYRDIAVTIHCSKDAVSRFLKHPGASPKSRKKRDSDSRTRALAIEADRDKPATECDNSATTATAPDREQMASMAFKDARTMRETALRGLRTVSQVKDLKDRTWMETSYLKILKESTKMLGAWGGLDALADSENHALEAYADAMKRIAEGEPVEGWETEP